MKATLADGQWCHYCRGLATTRDHVVPKALGGTNAAVNIVPACLPCNGAKADHWPDVDHVPGGCPICKAAIAHFQHVKPRRDLEFPKPDDLGIRYEQERAVRHQGSWSS